MEVVTQPLCTTTTAAIVTAKSFRRKQPLLIPQNPTYPSKHFPFRTTLSSPSRFPPPPVVSAAPENQLSVGEGEDTDTTEWALQAFYSLRKDVEITSQRVEEIRESSGIQLLEQELANLEEKASATSFWDNRAKAQETLSTLSDVKDKINLLAEFKTQVEDAETIVKLTEEMESSIDRALLEEATSLIKELNKSLDRFELTQLLSGPYDKEGAVISITAGAGGTDAQVNNYLCADLIVMSLFLSFLAVGENFYCTGRKEELVYQQKANFFFTS